MLSIFAEYTCVLAFDKSEEEANKQALNKLKMHEQNAGALDLMKINRCI